MKKSNTLLFLLIVLLSSCSSLFTSCSSDDDEVNQESLLPPITTTGENTFGCLIDGKYFRPRDGRRTVNSDNKGLRILQTEENNFEIIVTDYQSEKTKSLTIHLEDLLIDDEGVYTMNVSNGFRGPFGNDHSHAFGRFWKNDEVGYQRYRTYNGSGSVNISRREYNEELNYHVISGIFEINLINSNDATDTLRFALGRFDVDGFTFADQRFP